MNENRYRYSLEPSGNGRQYDLCPKCGHKRYTHYIDTETGEYLPNEYGRCERKDSCGYHKSPKEFINYLKTNKMKQENEMKEVVSEVTPDRIENNSSMLMGEKDYSHGALTFFLIRIFGEKAIEVLRLYRVMIAKQYHKDGKYGVAFLQIDKKGKIRQVKIMAYNPSTGKRLKENDEFLFYNKRTRKYEKSNPNTPASLYLGKQLMYDKEFVNAQCLFGSSLLNAFPDKTVAIVESEKTALICAIFMPQYIWLATGGQYGSKWTSPEVYNDFLDRKIILFPDLKATEDWKIKAESLVMDGMDITVYEGLEELATVEERAKGLDIADFIVKNKMQENPDWSNETLEKPTPVVLKAEVPAMTNLLKGFNQSKPNQNNSEESATANKDIIDLFPTEEKVAELSKPKKVKAQPDNSVKEFELDELWEDSDAVSDIE